MSARCVAWVLALVHLAALLQARLQRRAVTRALHELETGSCVQRRSAVEVLRAHYDPEVEGHLLRHALSASESEDVSDDCLEALAFHGSLRAAQALRTASASDETDAWLRTDASDAAELIEARYR